MSIKFLTEQEVAELYERGLKDGISQGRYQVLSTLLEIYNDSKYPEDLELDIDDYLRMEGMK